MTFGSLSEDFQSVMVADYRLVQHVLPHDYPMETPDRYQSWRWQAIETLNGDTRPSDWAHVVGNLELLIAGWGLLKIHDFDHNSWFIMGNTKLCLLVHQ